MLLGTIFNTLHLDLLCVYRKVERQVQSATPPPPFPVSPLGRELAPAQPSAGDHPQRSQFILASSFLLPAPRSLHQRDVISLPLSHVPVPTSKFAVRAFAEGLQFPLRGQLLPLVFFKRDAWDLLCKWGGGRREHNITWCIKCICSLRYFFEKGKLKDSV